jgi:transcriptional regulator GlxA family with amidase domain
MSLEPYQHADQLVVDALHPRMGGERRAVLNDAVAAALNCLDVTSVEELAAVVNASVRALERLFRALAGMSPKAVRNRFRRMTAVYARRRFPGAAESCKALFGASRDTMRR